MRVKNVIGSTQGLELTKEILYEVVDRETVLFLSGGSTPKSLYGALAKDLPAGKAGKKIKLGAVALVDERFGNLLHSDSNEKMIAQTGLFDYLRSKEIPLYPILRTNLRLHPKGVKQDLRLRTAEQYDGVVRFLFSRFSKRVAILGIGEDGHTAGIPPRNEKLKIKKEKFVTEFSDFPGEFRQRITLTFSALSKMNLLLVLVFGEKKKEVLQKMFARGGLEEVPARFYLQPDISKKTILITDQKV